MLLYLKLLLCAVFWGGTFIAGRIAAGQAAPFALAFLRFGVATVLLWIILRQREGAIPRLHGKQLWGVLLLGLTGIFAYNALFFAGLQTVPASRAAVIVTNNPIVIAIGAALFLGEPLSWRKAGGILLSVTGAVLAISRGNPANLWAEGLSWGDLALLGCLLSWAAYSLLGKVVMRGLSPLAAVTWSCTTGAIMLLPFAIWEGMLTAMPNYPVSVWVATAYLAVCGTVVGFTWFYEAVLAIGAAKAGVFINFVPVCAIISAWLLLGEALPLSLLLGAALVITGVYLTNKG